MDLAKAQLVGTRQSRKVYYLAGKERLELRDEPLPDLGPQDVLVKTLVSALSIGTEVWRYVNHGHYGGEGGQCGYNSVGEVVRVGAGVTQLRVGDRVFATMPHAEYFVVREDRAINIKLAPAIDLEAAAFTYLPTLGLHGLRSAGYQAGENVLVIGLGIVGVLAAQIARVVGARVAALEIDPGRRALAERLRFGPVLDPRESGATRFLDRYFGPPGPDIILETSQAWSGLADALRLAKPATRIAIIGIYRTPPVPDLADQIFRLTFMNRDHFHNQRLKIIGCSNDPADDYPPGIVRWTIQRNMAYVAEKIASGEMDTRHVITHRFRWDQLEEVYRRLVAGDHSLVGVVLHWD